MRDPTAAMLVIGDEILSGRTRDSNMHFLARALTAHGIALGEVRVVPDATDAIVAALRALAPAFTHVFTSGGIGPTHDDITADAVAAAFGAEIGVREDARRVLADFLEARGVEMTEARLRMARIPEGATLIDNPISAAPGFTIRNVHVCAGVPQIFEAMVDAVLAGTSKGPPMLSQSLRVRRPEGEIAAPLAALAARHPALSVGSYPFYEAGGHGADIVVRGHDGSEIDRAMTELAALFPEATA